MSATLQLPEPSATVFSLMEASKLKEQGDRIKQLRRHNRRTQEDVARAVRVSLKSVQMWEAGNSDPSFENLRALADYLGSEPDWIEYGRVHASHETPDMARTLDIGAEILQRMGKLETTILDILARLEGKIDRVIAEDRILTELDKEAIALLEEGLLARSDASKPQSRSGRRSRKAAG